MQTELRINHIAFLNSGSPELKIIKIENNRAEVEWLNDGKTNKTSFSLVCLRTTRPVD
jgi:hypothetical protein